MHQDATTLAPRIVEQLPGEPRTLPLRPATEDCAPAALAQTRVAHCLQARKHDLQSGRMRQLLAP
jgi:hypothetical protein